MDTGEGGRQQNRTKARGSGVGGAGKVQEGSFVWIPCFGLCNGKPSLQSPQAVTLVHIRKANRGTINRATCYSSQATHFFFFLFLLLGPWCFSKNGVTKGKGYMSPDTHALWACVKAFTPELRKNSLKGIIKPSH